MRIREKACFGGCRGAGGLAIQVVPGHQQKRRANSMQRAGYVSLEQHDRCRVIAIGYAVAQRIDVWAPLESAADLVMVAERTS